MKILFVKGTLPLSKLIMWGLDEPVSHFAVLFDDKIVFHSDLTGVHISWYPTFLKSHEVVFETEFHEANLNEEEEVYQSIVSKYDGKKYDYGAFIYFIYRGFLKKIFNKSMPKVNPFGKSGGFLCTEIAELLPDWVIPAIIKKNNDLGMVSPYQLWLLLNPRQ